MAIAGAGLGVWAVATPAHGQVPLEPLTITKIAADGEHFLPGSNAYYQIHVCNPNDVTVYLDNITDTLPSGFTYDADSASGLATFNPNIAGQTLTWLFDGQNVGGLQCSNLNFSVTISAEEPLGMYCNEATVDWGSGTASTGSTAPIQVLNEGDTQVTPTCGGRRIVHTATPTFTATAPATATEVPATATPVRPTATATKPAGGSEGVISAPNTGSGPQTGGPSTLLLVLAGAMIAGGVGAAAVAAKRR